MHIKKIIKDSYSDKKLIARFPLTVFAGIWLFQLLGIVFLSKGRLVDEVTPESIGILAMGLGFTLIIQIIPFLVIAAYCEHLNKKEKNATEVLVKMLSMTVPLAVVFSCLMLFPVFNDTSSDRSGWAMGLGFLAMFAVPLILLLGWLLGKALYDTYFAKEFRDEAHIKNTNQ